MSYSLIVSKHEIYQRPYILGMRYKFGEINNVVWWLYGPLLK